MGLFDFMRTDRLLDMGVDSAPFNERLHYQQVEEDNRYMYGEIRELQESMLELSDAFDAVGWGGFGDVTGNDYRELDTVKNFSKVCRGLTGMNPFVKRGVDARVSYIWGKGVTFDGVDSLAERFTENRRRFFSPQAYEEFERALATDGNVFTAIPVDDEDDAVMQRISLDEIFGIVCNPDDPEDVYYYKRQFIRSTTQADGTVKQEEMTVYYPSLGYYSRLKKKNKLSKLRARFSDGKVSEEYVIQHTAVNKQVGWRWGLPDVAAVMFWAKAYKEYLEDNAALVKAYSQIAWQAQGPNAQGAQAMAAQLRRPAGRDPVTGQALPGIGGTTVGTQEMGLKAVPAIGSSVDFSKGSPLASGVAAGLSVPLVVITSDSGNSNRSAAESLDLPTLKTMEARQNLHVERFLELFEFWGIEVNPFVTNNTDTRKVDGDKAKTRTIDTDTDTDSNSDSQYAIVTYPAIETPTLKDRISSIGTGIELGIIFKEEGRKDALDALGIAPMKAWDELPPEPAQNQGSVIPGQGVNGGISAQGGSLTRSNEARDNRENDENNF